MDDTDLFDDIMQETSVNEEVIALAPGQLDPRMQLLSYSSLLTLHKCPRKFELYRKKAKHNEQELVASRMQTLTFAFGHMLGKGIQDVLEGRSFEWIVFDSFTNWYADLLEVDEKRNKSFFKALHAIEIFYNQCQLGMFAEYELLVFNGRPATELAFKVNLPKDFVLRGAVDAVLRHKETGEVVVLEVKTTSAASSNIAEFQNSSQAVGYSVVLDKLCPDLVSYKVMYLIFNTRSTEYTILQVPKSYARRAMWLQELMLDVQMVVMYNDMNVFPTRGESCYDWYRPCEYLHQCTLDTELITAPLTAKALEDTKVYDVILDVEDLVEAQLRKVFPIKHLSAPLAQDGDTFL